MTWCNQKECHFCHQLFWPYRLSQRVCYDPKCRDYSRTQDGRVSLGWRQPKLLRERTCAACGISFENHHGAKTCSIECQKVYSKGREDRDKIKRARERRKNDPEHREKVRIKQRHDYRSKRLIDGEYYAAQTKKRRERYHNNPEYRAKIRAREHNRLLKQLEDPVFVAKYREYNAAQVEKRRERYHNDPEYRAKIKNEAKIRMKEKYQSDPEYRAKVNQRLLELKRKWIENPKGERQWLIKSRHELSMIRRFLRNPQEVLPSLDEE